MSEPGGKTLWGKCVLCEERYSEVVLPGHGPRQHCDACFAEVEANLREVREAPPRKSAHSPHNPAKSPKRGPKPGARGPKRDRNAPAGARVVKLRYGRAAYEPTVHRTFPPGRKLA